MFSYLEKKPIIPTLITIAIAIFIFYMSSLTFPPGEPGFPLKAIIYHVGIFAALAFFLNISLTKGKSKHLLPIAITLAILYGISDELHQFFVPSRSCSPLDIFYNTFGILAATVLYLFILDIRKTTFSPKQQTQ